MQTIQCLVRLQLCDNIVITHLLAGYNHSSLVQWSQSGRTRVDFQSGQFTIWPLSIPGFNIVLWTNGEVFRANFVIFHRWNGYQWFEPILPVKGEPWIHDLPGLEMILLALQEQYLLVSLTLSHRRKLYTFCRYQTCTLTRLSLPFSMLRVIHCQRSVSRGNGKVERDMRSFMRF